MDRIGWRRVVRLVFFVGSPFQVPGGPAWALSGPAHRASSVAVPFFAHTLGTSPELSFEERLCFFA